MSRETNVWLNTMTLIGQTLKRGNAWHYRAESQGAEPNHYDGPVPVEDVRRRLFHWEPVEAPMVAQYTSMDADGVETVSIVDDSRKVIIRPRGTFGDNDTGAILGAFRSSYRVHSYTEWLLSNVAVLCDAEYLAGTAWEGLGSDAAAGTGLAIGSAGLLKGGAVAWVSVEVPESITTPEGVVFRPNLLATTSLDGSLATTYKRVVTNVVCDNTHGAALGEAGQAYKVKHSSKSLGKLSEARDALAIVHSIADDFSAEVAKLSAVKVSDGDWARFLDTLAPVPTDEGRSRTLAQSKQGELTRLYRHDERVAPWAGTAWGVVQAVNTYTHHSGTVRNADRGERNMLRAVSGGVDKLDAETVDMLTAVMA